MLEFKELFTKQESESPEDELFDFITDFLIKTQMSADLAKISRLLIDHSFHK